MENYLESKNVMAKRHEVIVVGAGPIGLECAVNLSLNDIDYSLLDAGALGSTIQRWETGTHFLSTPERLEIAGFPLQSVDQLSPTKDAYLAYLRSIVEAHDIALETFTRVQEIKKTQNGFELLVEKRGGIESCLAEKVVLATGAMHEEKGLDIPGCEQRFVHSAVAENHQYFRKKVLIIGDRNSALEKMIRVFRLGASVSVLIPEQDVDPDAVRVEYLREWRLLTDKEKVKVFRNARLESIDGNGNCKISSDGNTLSEGFDFLIPCTGYQYNPSFLHDIGIATDEEGNPHYNSETMETNLPGLFLAGTVAGGTRLMKELFIGTCHEHIEKILRPLRPSPKLLLGSPAQRHYRFSYDEIKERER